MGRKIPGKKHKGVKDPLQQLAKRNQSLSAKVNAPPTQPDDQSVPKSLIRLMKLKDDVKQGKFKHKKKRKKRKRGEWLIDTKVLAEKDHKVPGMTRPDKPVPHLIQRPGESEFHFLRRIEQACQEVIKESQFEDKFGVNVIRDTDTGEVVNVVKKPKDPVLEFDATKKKKKNNDSANATDSLSKTARRRQKKLERKQLNNSDKERDFDMFKDNVKFGEVVSEPPQLKAPKGIKSNPLESKPGRKDLLLKTFLENKYATTTTTTTTTTTSSSSAKLDLTVKRKKLPAAELRQLELQRQAAVNAYRFVKSKNLDRRPLALLEK
ncbi:coiled-coil domain-containing protein 137 isoform X1 [Schistocerca gregaria]|uniref:coiled-coil domain-containing protein 137 isoform X1 n=2 Tax=Schistocerca gregaria TaxID=7010 RepID=UPI00211E09F8|nr:coiled-coil domain-containing protein 137 isoform X1 [Schistocerca gregaria]